MYDYLIVGCGFAGAVLAERLAAGGQKEVLIIDKRHHIAGNAFDRYNDEGVLIHQYGPHIFHTNSEGVFDYLGRFTQWRPYEHKVMASVDGQLVPIPININTINALYGLQLSAAEMEQYLASVAEEIVPVRSSEDLVLSTVGKDLYEKFFKGYTTKQWGMPPSALDASVAARVPTRTNKDNRYFTDKFQAMPLHGYTRMFENMLRHPNIHVMLNTDFEDVKHNIPYKKLIYTGPVDAYFGYCFGALPYRSLHFEMRTLDQESYQDWGTINYPLSQQYTRITEFKKLTGQRHHKTTIVFEYPRAEGDPYYPIPRKENQELYNKYKALAEQLKDVYFTGRLGTYKYHNMDQVVARSLTLYKKLMLEEGVTVNGQLSPAEGIALKT